jgi:hypothetical protein
MAARKEQHNDDADNQMKDFSDSFLGIKSVQLKDRATDHEMD